MKNVNSIDGGFEVIFVDNNSTDKSRNIVEDNGYHVESATEHASSYYARNVGVSVANGKFLIFIDSDCIVPPDLIVRYNNYLVKSKRPEYTVFAGDIIANKRDETNKLEYYAYKRKVLNQKSAITGWAYKPFAQTANAMYSRKMFIEAGGFNPTLTSGGDAEICWRFSKLFDCDYVYAEEAFVYHQHRKTLKDFSDQFRKYGRGRIQQLGVSKDLAQAKNEDITSCLSKIESIFSSISELEDEEKLFEFIDFIRDISYSLGKYEQLQKEIEKITGQSGFAAIGEFINNKVIK